MSLIGETTAKQVNTVGGRRRVCSETTRPDKCQESAVAAESQGARAHYVPTTVDRGGHVAVVAVNGKCR